MNRSSHQLSHNLARFPGDSLPVVPPFSNRGRFNTALPSATTTAPPCLGEQTSKRTTCCCCCWFRFAVSVPSPHILTCARTRKGHGRNFAGVPKRAMLGLVTMTAKYAVPVPYPKTSCAMPLIPYRIFHIRYMGRRLCTPSLSDYHILIVPIIPA